MIPDQTARAPRAVDTSVVECEDHWQPADEEVAQANEENRALAAVLASAGVEAELTADPSGFEYLEWDYADGVAQSVVNSFYRDRYPDEGFFEEAIPEEELQRMIEENAALSVVLDEAGVAYELVTEEAGFEWVEWDEEDSAAQAVVEAFSNEFYPSEPIPEAELAQIREENAALAAALDQAGVAYELITEEIGFEWVEWDYEDRAAQAVVDAFYAELYGNEFEDGFEGDFDEACFGEDAWVPTQEEIDQNNAETNAMATAFDAAGITYTVQNDELGFQWLEWDFEDPEVQAVAEVYWGTEEGVAVADISADLDRLAAAFDTAGSTMSAKATPPARRSSSTSATRPLS